MRKVLLARDLQDVFRTNHTFLDRDDIVVFTAATNEEALQIHKWEAVDLIVAHPDMPDMDPTGLFHAVRDSQDLCSARIILVAGDSPAERERCKRYAADAVFHLPADAGRLRLRVQHFLNVTPRAGRRTALALDIKGNYRDKPLLFRTQDISSRGMLIKSDAPLLAGDGISFSFFLPDNTHVNGFGKIARDGRHAADSYYYGVKFTVLEPSIRAAIESALNA